MRTLFQLALWAVCLLIGCEKNKKDFLAANRQNLLYVRSSTDSLEADGKSMLTLTAKLVSDADLKTVRFTTNNGTFLDSIKTYSAEATPSGDSLVAKAYLISSLEPTNYVSIKVSASGIDTTLALRFVTAYANRIKIETATPSLQRKFTSEAPVDVFLFRSIGTPSLHQNVTFKAIKDNDATIGEFRGISLQGSDANGTIKATYSLKDTTYLGRVRLIADYRGKDSSLYSDTVKIFITN